MWTRTHELLASVVEVVSVGVAEKALRDPIRVPRPERVLSDEQIRADRQAQEVPIGDAVEMFAAQGRVRKAPPRPQPVEVGA